MGRRYKPDVVRVEQMDDWSDSHPDEICDICGCRLKDHAPVSGFEWLNRLCDGELVRLR